MNLRLWDAIMPLRPSIYEPTTSHNFALGPRAPCWKRELCTLPQQPFATRTKSPQQPEREKARAEGGGGGGGGRG